MKQSHSRILIAYVGLIVGQVSAAELSEEMKQCYTEQFQQSQDNRTVGEIEQWCQTFLESQKKIQNEELSPLEKRIIRERNSMNNPSVITPHKRNYLLPVTYLADPNEAPYQNFNALEGNLDNWEAKFQLSFKAPLAQSLLTEKDIVFFGFTIQSYWQMYNSDVSAPFRETNYQPEIFYGFMNDLKVGEWTNRGNIIGIEHQSNGRSQPLSRSWNRIYAHFIWENDNWVIGLKPWYRIPEDEKADPNQPDGDDNPDIDKYMGNFEFTSVYKWEEQTFGVMLRNNLRSDNRGAIQLDWTFPMGSRFKGYAQYFNGYGESLIDYNESIQRLGFGVLLTDFF